MTRNRPTRLPEGTRWRVSYVDTVGREEMLHGKPFGGSSGDYFVSPEYLRDAFDATVEFVDAEQGTLNLDAPPPAAVGPNAMSDRDFYSALLDRLGFIDGAEVTADGSADNDLAAERAKAVLRFIALARQSAWPEGLLPKVAAQLCDGTTTCGSDAHVEGCMAMAPDGPESASPCDRPVVAGTGRCDQHQCNGDWACPAKLHAAGCMVLSVEEPETTP